MFFLTLSGADVDFSDREVRWRTYTTHEALPITRYIELVGKKEFSAVALDPEHETLVVHVASVHVASLCSTPLNADVYPSRRPQIADLIAEEAPTNVLAKYANFADVTSLIQGSTTMLSSWSMVSNYPMGPSIA